MTATVGDLLLRTAGRWPDADALVEDETVLTYAQAAAAAARVARRLAARGVRPGDRIALAMPNGWRYAVSYYGIQLAGATKVFSESGGSEELTALQRGDVTLGLAFTSDGAVAADKLVVLKDDKGLATVDNIANVSGTSPFPFESCNVVTSDWMHPGNQASETTIAVNQNPGGRAIVDPNNPGQVFVDPNQQTGANRFSPAFGLGTAISLGRNSVLDLAYRFMDLGEIRTGSAVTSAAGVTTGISPIKAELFANVLTAGVGFGF